MDKRKILEGYLKKVKEKSPGANIKIASDMSDFKLLDTPFPSVNTLIGGVPLGRFSVFAGPFHTGKGVFCLQLIAHQQQKDPDFFTLWSDFEAAYDPVWAEKLGVDTSRVIMQRYTPEFNTMEKVLDQALSLIKESRSITLWVIDSIGALVPKADILDSKNKEKELEGDKMLNLQRKLGEFFRKANVIVAPDEKVGYEGCAVACIGQIYTVPSATSSLEEVKGGNAFKHWAHLRLMFRRGPKVDWPEPIEMIGIDGNKRKVYPGWAARLRLDKTRMNENEGKEVLLTFMHGRGFDSKSAVIAAGFGLGLFERKGPIYSSDLLPEGKIKGKENLIQYFNENEEAYKKLVEKVNAAALEGHSLITDEPEEKE